MTAYDQWLARNGGAWLGDQSTASQTPLMSTQSVPQISSVGNIMQMPGMAMMPAPTSPAAPIPQQQMPGPPNGQPPQAVGGMMQSAPSIGPNFQIRSVADLFRLMTGNFGAGAFGGFAGPFGGVQQGGFLSGAPMMPQLQQINTRLPG